MPGSKDKFVATWDACRSETFTTTLYDYLDRAMPQFAPGTLKPEGNAELIACLLKANGLPAGSTPASCRQHRITADQHRSGSSRELSRVFQAARSAKTVWVRSAEGPWRTWSGWSHFSI
jgi:hypothetical protein